LRVNPNVSETSFDVPKIHCLSEVDDVYSLTCSHDLMTRKTRENN